MFGYFEEDATLIQRDFPKATTGALHILFKPPHKEY